MQREKLLDATPRRDRLDAPAPTPPAPHGEIKAVQLERSTIVRTAQGDQHARAGQWLVTEADGTVRIVSDEVFRMETLRSQLLQMIQRGQRRSKRF
jgi:hypothetical protein